MIELLIPPLAWCLQLYAAAFIPRCLMGLVKKKTTGRKTRILSVIIVLAAILSVVLVSLFPPVICPEEYGQYVDETDIKRIQRFNAGIWSPYIPVFPVCIRITHADDTEIKVTTQYFLFGSSSMNINHDGYERAGGFMGYLG